MTTIKAYDADDNEVELPAKFAVCPRCEGEGKHVNPAIDGNGITASEMEELGEDFREDYLNGVYDIACEECGGRRVVAVFDESRASAEERAIYERHVHAKAEHAAEIRSEQRYIDYLETRGY